MKLLNRLFKRPQGFSALQFDHDSLEDMVVPLLVSLMGVIVLFSLI